MVRSFIGASTTLDNVALHDIALSLIYIVLCVHFLNSILSFLFLTENRRIRINGSIIC